MTKYRLNFSISTLLDNYPSMFFLSKFIF